MQVVDLVRKFKYNSITLNDPNPALTPEQVKEVFAGQYPELTNSVVEGPVTKDGVATYTFARAVGSKGAAAHEVVAQALTRRPESHSEALQGEAAENRYAGESARIAQVCQSQRGMPMPLPAQAFGLWG